MTAHGPQPTVDGPRPTAHGQAPTEHGPRIRVLAAAIPRRGDAILVERGHDPVAGRTFLRLIGGGVEFGESAAEAVTREWREELGVTLHVGTLVGVLENRFVYRGAPGHEVVFVFEAMIAESWPSEQDRFETVEPDGLRHDAEWVPLDRLEQGAMPFYPDGAAALIRHATATRPSEGLR